MSEFDELAQRITRRLKIDAELGSAGGVCWV